MSGSGHVLPPGFQVVSEPGAGPGDDHDKMVIRPLGAGQEVREEPRELKGKDSFYHLTGDPIFDGSNHFLPYSLL